jgi:L-ascorbate metabolism protein UlaG (beta-lactamase superfamily)
VAPYRLVTLRINVTMLSIGDNFSIGPADAVKAGESLQPKAAILVHDDISERV